MADEPGDVLQRFPAVDEQRRDNAAPASVGPELIVARDARRIGRLLDQPSPPSGAGRAHRSASRTRDRPAAPGRRSSPRSEPPTVPRPAARAAARAARPRPASASSRPAPHRSSSAQAAGHDRRRTPTPAGPGPCWRRDRGPPRPDRAPRRHASPAGTTWRRRHRGDGPARRRATPTSVPGRARRPRTHRSGSASPPARGFPRAPPSSPPRRPPGRASGDGGGPSKATACAPTSPATP
jgi:hypothetical protein